MATTQHPHLGTTVAILIAAAVAAPMGAQQSGPTRDSTVRAIDAVVVTAARREQRLKDAVVPTAVISHKEITRSGASDVGTVLLQFAGIQLDAGVGGGTGAMLQGLDSRRVLVLLDGRPLVGRVNGNFDLARIPVAGVDRIEIVKGPQSTLYGSEAMGGVINIITRSMSGAPIVELGALSGTHNRHEATAGGRATRGDWRFSADGSWYAMDLTPGISGEVGTHDQRLSVTPGVEWHASPSITWNANAFLLDQSQRYLLGQLYQFSDNTQIDGRLGMTWRHGLTTLFPLFHISRYDHLSRAATGPDAVAGTGQRDIQSLTELGLTGSTLLGNMLWDAGLEARHDAIDAARVQGQTRNLDAVEGYTQATWAQGPLSLVPGIRLTHNVQFGDFAAPRLAALWHAGDDVAVRASYGRGFRAPDFKELYLSFVNSAVGYAVKGNPELRPETSTNLQVSVDWTAPHGLLRASAFDNQFHDFINTGAPDATGTYSYANIAHGFARGAELEGQLALGTWRWDAGYAYLDSRDASNNGPLPGRAAHTARVALAMPVPGHGDLSTTWVYTGRTPIATDTAGAVTSWRPEFQRIDLRLAQPIRADLTLTAGINNVFDRQMQAAWPGYTGRLFMLGAQWRSAGR